MIAVRVGAVLAGVLLSLLALTLAAQPVLAQGVSQPSPSTPGLGELLSDSQKWFGDMFNAALAAFSQRALDQTVGFMNWLMGSGSVISQTPAALSYDNAAVKDLWTVMLGVADAGLVAVTVWGGANLMIHPHIRAPYHGALELVPRVLLSGIMINTSLSWGHFVIDMNNALCQTIGGASIPGWDHAQQQVPDGGALLLNLIAMSVYLVMGLLLMAQMLMRLALVDVLLVIAPLALLCWVLPQTYSWARLWFNTFFGAVFVQAIQVLVLHLGMDLTQSLPSLLPQVASNPLDGGYAWLMTLLLGMAVLQLTRNIPKLIPGSSSALGSGSSDLSNMRQIQQLINSVSKKKGRK